MLAFNLQRSAEIFFDDFDTAFATFDGTVIATRYLKPYLAIRSNGTSECFSTNIAIAEYFQRIVANYRRLGCRYCRHKDLNVLEVGSSAAFASVTWELLDGDKKMLLSWSESYNLVRCGSTLKACASMDHAR